jgi:hypothetical protein
MARETVNYSDMRHRPIYGKSDAKNATIEETFRTKPEKATFVPD